MILQQLVQLTVGLYITSSCLTNIKTVQEITDYTWVHRRKREVRNIERLRQCWKVSASTRTCTSTSIVNHLMKCSLKAIAILWLLWDHPHLLVYAAQCFGCICPWLYSALTTIFLVVSWLTWSHLPDKPSCIFSFDVVSLCKSIICSWIALLSAFAVRFDCHLIFNGGMQLVSYPSQELP